MSETTTAPKAAMFAAIAKLQADLPRIAKGETAKVTSDKGSYSYKYADLADVAAQVMPLLGKHGLGFIARPTLNGDGKFVLAYSLVHESGEREDGEYPLGTGSPQQIGSLITYARRYTLCAVTGTTPDGDDDGKAAEDGYRHSVGEAPRGRDQQHGTVTRPQSQPAKGQPSAAPETDDSDWGIALAEIVTSDDADRVEASIKAAHDAGRMKPVKANALRQAIKAKRGKLADAGAPA